MLSKFKSNMIAPILVAFVYLLLLLSRIIDITGVTGENEYVGVIVLQIFIFLLPSVIYSRLRGEGYTERLRLRFLSGQQVIVTLLGAMTLICGSLLLSIIFANGASEDGFSLYNSFVASHNGSAETVIFVTVAYGIVPAICEEFLFRSILSAEYEEYGITSAFIMSTLLFGMIHFDFGQLVIYFFAGAVLFSVFYATRSVLGSIIVHFLYNLYGLFGQGFAGEVYSTTGSTELFLLLLFGAFLLFAALFCGEVARLYRRYSRQNISSAYLPRRKKGDGVIEALLAPGALVCYLMFILAALLF